MTTLRGYWHHKGSSDLDPVQPPGAEEGWISSPQHTPVTKVWTGCALRHVSQFPQLLECAHPLAQEELARQRHRHPSLHNIQSILARLQVRLDIRRLRRSHRHRLQLCLVALREC